jgi:hypothetical protein
VTGRVDPTGTAEPHGGAEAAWERAWDAVLSDEERTLELDDKVHRLIALDAEAALGPPTVVMGIAKSGTSAAAAALREAGVPRVFQIHSLLPRALAETERDYRAANPGKRPWHVWDSQYLAHRLPTPDAPWRMVVTVREPIGQAIAAFFQTASRRGGLVGASVDSLLAEFDHGFTGMVHRWPDIQLRNVLDLDLHEHPFDPAVGTTLIERPDIRALVMRRESLDRAPEALARLIGRAQPVPLPRANVAEDKEYAGLYRGFLDAIRVAPEVLDRAYSSRFARHFYSEDELAGFRARWEGRRR